MGKMGAGELNYSSDIDLICLFDETRFDARRLPRGARAAFIRATRRMAATLSDHHRRGLRLPHRPAPAPRPLGHAGLPVDGGGRALLRKPRPHLGARGLHQGAPCAGDIAAGERFLDTLRPFVWRKHLDYRRHPGRARHAPAHPRAQGPARRRTGRPRPQARPGRHPRDRVLHPDPPAHRRRPRPRPARARHGRGALRAVARAGCPRWPPPLPPTTAPIARWSTGSR
jgi:hypothetical protein